MLKATKNVPPSKSPESRKQRRIIRNLFKAQNAAIAAEADGDADALEYFTARAETLEAQLSAMELEIRTPRVKKADADAKPAGRSKKAKATVDEAEVEVAPDADVLEAVA